MIIPDETDTKILYFIKTHQNLFEDDKLYKQILNETLELLALELKEKIGIMMCNRIDNKIRKFLN